MDVMRHNVNFLDKTLNIKYIARNIGYNKMLFWASAL